MKQSHLPYPLIFALFTGAIGFLGMSCSGTKGKKSAAVTPTPTPNQTTDPGTGGSTSLSDFRIEEASSGASTSLTVAINQQVTWRFVVRGGSTSTGTGTVQRIEPRATVPTGWVLQGVDSVTFRPTTQADLSGSLTVSGVDPNNNSVSTTFYWTGAPGTSSSGNGLLSMLPMILNAVIPQLISGNFDIGSILTSLLGAFSMQPSYGTGYTNPNSFQTGGGTGFPAGYNNGVSPVGLNTGASGLFGGAGYNANNNGIGTGINQNGLTPSPTPINQIAP